MFVSILLHQFVELERDFMMSAIPIAGGALTLVSTFASERIGAYRVVSLCLWTKFFSGIGSHLTHI